MELGYARVSTSKQDLERQIDALTAHGVPSGRIYLDRKSGATTDRPGLRAVLEYARAGDVVVVHTLDRLGRTVRDTLNLIHDLAERGVGVRNLADPIKVDSANPADPMAQLAVVLLALFGQMERTYLIERAAHARSVAVAKGRQVGRPVTVSPAQLAYAEKLRQAGDTIAQIVAKTGITRSSLYRHLPPRPAPLLTATAPAEQVDRRPGDDRPADVSCGGSGSITADVPVIGPSAGRPAQRLPVVWSGQDLLEAVDWPDTYRPACSGASRRSAGCASGTPVGAGCASWSLWPWPGRAAAPSTRTRRRCKPPLLPRTRRRPMRPCCDRPARSPAPGGQRHGPHGGSAGRACLRRLDVEVSGLVSEPVGYAELLEQLKARVRAS